MDGTPKNSAAFGAIVMLIFGLIAFYLGYLVIIGIFVPLLFAMIFAVIFHPVYAWLLRVIKMEIVSSFLCCLILILIVLSLVSFTIYLAVGQVVSITKIFTQTIDFQGFQFLTDLNQLQALVDQTTQRVNQLLVNVPFIDAESISEIVSGFLKNIPPLLQQLSSYLIGATTIAVENAAKLLISLIIFFISFFFLLIDGKGFVEYAFRLLPINALHERQITKRFSNLCYAWIVVTLLIAFIQGSLATIGFVIIGVPSPFIWGIISMLASFIPFVGSTVIWASIGIIYFLLGNYASAIFIFVWGAIMVSSIDNFLRPFLLKEGVKIHPLILFLAVFGGFFAFKVPGLVIGPLIMVFISTMLYIYELEFSEVLQKFHEQERRVKRISEEE